MMGRRDGMVRSVIVALVAVLMAGCGGDSESGQESLLKADPAETLRSALADAGPATTFRLETSGTQDGEPLRIDASYAPTKGFVGTMDIGDSRVTFTVIGTELYWKGNPAYYERILSQPNAAKVQAEVGDRYLRTALAQSPLSSLAEAETALNDLKKGAEQELKSKDLVVSRGPDVNGVPTVKYNDAEDSNDAEFIIADDGTGRLLRGVVEFDETTRITLSEIGNPVDLTRPPGVVEMSSIELE